MNNKIFIYLSDFISVFRKNDIECREEIMRMGNIEPFFSRLYSSESFTISCETGL